MNKFVVATVLAVAVKPVIVGAVKPSTQGSVVALHGGHRYPILFLARNGCKTLSSQLGQTNAGICLFATALLNSTCQAVGVVGVAVSIRFKLLSFISIFIAQAKAQALLY